MSSAESKLTNGPNELTERLRTALRRIGRFLHEGSEGAVPMSTITVPVSRYRTRSAVNELIELGLVERTDAKWERDPILTQPTVGYRPTDDGWEIIHRLEEMKE